MPRPTTGSSARASSSVKWRGIRSDGNRFFSGDGRVMRSDVLIQDRDELRYDGIPAQREGKFAVDINRRYRLFKRAGQRDSDIRVLRFARTIHHTSHHRDLHRLDPAILAFPERHALAQIS